MRRRKHKQHKGCLNELVVRRVQKTPRKMKAIDVALGCFPVLENRTLLPKTLHTSDAGFKDIELELLWNSSY